MPMRPVEDIREQALGRLFEADSQGYHRAGLRARRAHPVFAPLAWFVCFVLGAAGWAVLAVYIANFL